MDFLFSPSPLDLHHLQHVVLEVLSNVAFMFMMPMDYTTTVRWRGLYDCLNSGCSYTPWSGVSYRLIFK